MYLNPFQLYSMPVALQLAFNTSEMGSKIFLHYETQRIVKLQVFIDKPDMR